MSLNHLEKTIVCYGDSNTWGSIPGSDERYTYDIRWPGALQSILGHDYHIVSEGLCGRTLVATNPKKPHRTGITHLQSILESADPVDLIIIMLGTNDIKSTYNLTPQNITEHLKQTVEYIRNMKSLIKSPKIMIVCPPAVIVPESGILDTRMIPGINAFKILPQLFEKTAQSLGCGFLNAGKYISSSIIDGYHLDKESHLKLAELIGEWVKENL